MSSERDEEALAEDTNPVGTTSLKIDADIGSIRSSGSRSGGISNDSDDGSSVDPSTNSGPSLGAQSSSHRTSTSNSPSNETFPRDTYSFIALSGPKKDGSWPRERILFFVFGLIPAFFQLLFLGLLLFSQTSKLRGTIGETDNPDSNKDGNFFASFIHANATPISKWSQVASMAAYVIFPNSSLQDIIKAVQLFPQAPKKASGDRIGFITFACCLRFIQGVIAMLVTLVLVLTSTTVVEIILSFTAVNFISVLDEDAFSLAITGGFGPTIRAEAERISNLELPSCMMRKEESKWKRYKMVVGVSFLFLFGAISFVFISQESDARWVTGTLRVQFQESTGLNQYSGCFEIDRDPASMSFSRRAYNSVDVGPSKTSFGYCRNNRRWVLYKGETSDPCEASKSTEQALAFSSKTDSFDISTVFDEGWVSSSNTPLNLYFFDGTDETEITEHCSRTLNDGKCDSVFNKLGYDYDGGDCCAATCTNPNCGIDGLTTVFGSNVTGDGYEDCVDPTMVPITIHLNSMTSSRDESFISREDFFFLDDEDLDGGPITITEDEYNVWKEATPVSPYFSLDCNGKNVMTAFIDNSMVKKSQTVRVEDGAVCTLVVRNNIVSNWSDRNDPPIWYIDYTIFHGESANEVEILTSDSYDAEAVNFTRLPECYFSKLKESDLESLYSSFTKPSVPTTGVVSEEPIEASTDCPTGSTGQLSSKKAVNWLLEAPVTALKSQCENFMERYALVTLDFAMEGLYREVFINRDNQCRWQGITCSGGYVRSITLGNLVSKMDLPRELLFLSSLKEIDLWNNGLSRLPSWIGDLETLEFLHLSYNELKVLPASLGDLSSLTLLDLSHNELNDTVPDTIGKLSSLTSLDLSDNALNTLPISIGDLSSLTLLDLSGNSLNDTVPDTIGDLSSLTSLDLSYNTLNTLPISIGDLSSLNYLSLQSNELVSIPAELGNLTRLSDLNLARNKFNSFPSGVLSIPNLRVFKLGSNPLRTLPTEIGKLSSLTSLYLWGISLTSIPTEIGKLSSLMSLDLGSNSLTSIPTEIGKLSSLTSLDLSGNDLENVPTEIGNLSSLTYLYLSYNDLENLPTEIGNLSSLTELYLDGNALRSIPSEIGNLSNLSSAWLSNNNITTFPSEALKIPNLHLRFVGNDNLVCSAELLEFCVSVFCWLPSHCNFFD